VWQKQRAARLVSGRDEDEDWGWHVVTLVLGKHETNIWAKLAQNKHVVCRWHLPWLQNNTLDICVMIFCWGCCHMMLVIHRNGISFRSSCEINFLICQSVSQSQNEYLNTVIASLSLRIWNDTLACWFVEVKLDSFVVSAIDPDDHSRGNSLDPRRKERDQP
jgi:hypothetical protein